MRKITVFPTDSNQLTLIRLLLDEMKVRYVSEKELTKEDELFIKSTDNEKVDKKPSEYKGILSDDLTKKMQDHVKQSREEWENRIL